LCEAAFFNQKMTSKKGTECLVWSKENDKTKRFFIVMANIEKVLYKTDNFQKYFLLRFRITDIYPKERIVFVRCKL